MPDLDLRGIATTAKLAGHPLHPMLVPFPIAFFVATFACDVVFWATHDEFWALMGMWALGAGIVMAALAAVAGFTDFLGNARIRSIGHAWHHMLGMSPSLSSRSLAWGCGRAKAPPTECFHGAWFYHSLSSCCCSTPVGRAVSLPMASA